MISRISSRRQTRPSDSRKPAASSSSFPGVRMVTLSGRVSTRISKGSSAANSSLWKIAGDPRFQRRTRWSSLFKQGLAVLQLLHAHPRILIRHATGRIGHAAADDDVAFGPVNLQVAASNGRKKNTTLETAQVILQNHAVVLDEAQGRSVLGTHQHGVARRAVDRVGLGVNQCIELVAAAGRD